MARQLIRDEAGYLARRTISNTYEDFAFAYALASSCCSPSAFFKASIGDPRQGALEGSRGT
jgi:hypothetical protein